MSMLDNVTPFFTPVDLDAICYYVRGFETWAGYTVDKVPKKAGAILRGDAFDFGTEDAKKFPNARSNDPSSLAAFNDICKALWQNADTRIHGPSFALKDEQNLICIDLDTFKRAPATFASAEEYEYARALHAQGVQQILTLCHGRAYIEKSLSGAGYHIFLRGRLPKSRYSVLGNGSIFTAGQFIHMTGNVIDGSTPVLGEDQIYIDQLMANLLTQGIVRESSKDEIDNAVALEELVCTTDQGRLLHLSDTEVWERLVQRGAFNVGLWNYDVNSAASGVLADHSGAVFKLLGEIDKITGDPEQARRLLFASPLLIKAGKDSNKQDRWYKTQRTFYVMLSRNRGSNNPMLEKRAAAVQHGRENFEKLLSPDAAGSIAFKKEEPIRIAKDIKAPVEAVSSRGYTKQAIQAVNELMGEMPPEYMVECLPVGFAAELVKFGEKAMYEPVQDLAIASTLAMLSALNARRCKLVDGQGPTLNFFLGATTGLGKNQTLECWKTLVENVIDYDCINYAATHRQRYMELAVASRAGLSITLQKNACFCDTNEECEPMLKALGGQNVDKNDAMLKSFWLSSFDTSKAAKRYSPDISVASQNRGDLPVFNVSVSSFWATTMMTATKYIDINFLSSGLGSRLIYLLYKGTSGKNQKRHEVLRALPQGEARRRIALMLQLAEELDLIYDEGLISSPGVFPKEVYGSPTQRSAVTEIREAPGVGEAIENVLDQINVFKIAWQKNAAKYPSHYSAFFRVGMLAPRIAGLLAIADNPVSPEISLPMFHWAYGYILQKIATLVSSFDTKELGATIGDANETTVGLFKRMLVEPGRDNVGGLRLDEFMRRLRNIKPFHGHENVNSMARNSVAECADQGIFDIREKDAGDKTRWIFVTRHAIWNE